MEKEVSAAAVMRHTSIQNAKLQELIAAGLRLIENKSIEVRLTVSHVGHFGDIPCRNVLIEDLRGVKHFLHVGHFGDIPCRNVLIEGLRVGEH